MQNGYLSVSYLAIVKERFENLEIKETLITKFTKPQKQQYLTVALLAQGL